MNFTETKYIYFLSTQLRNFRKKSENLFNFSCPLCGDSKSNKRKARGYIYEDDEGEAVYKCHNCGVVKKFSYFLKDLDGNLYKQYRLELFKDNAPAKYIQRKQPDPTLDVFFESKVNLADYIGKVATVESALAYLRKRKIPEKWYNEIYYTDDLNIIKPIFKNTNYDKLQFSKEPRIVLPCYNVNGGLVGVICRSMAPKPKLRYVNLRYDNDDPFIFGLDKVNLGNRKFILEGAFDSMFLNNSIAVDGASFNKASHFLNKDNDILIFDNDARNKEVINNMYNMSKKGYKLFIWPKYLKFKDINECVQNGINNIQEIIENNNFSNLQLDLKIAEWKKI